MPALVDPTEEDVMEATTADSLAADAVEQFMGTVGVELAAPASVAMAVLGDRLGLYRALAASGPLASSELASRTGCAERYVREWLCNQAADGWVLYEEETQRFSLPAAHAAVVADEGSPAFLGGSVQVVRDSPGRLRPERGPDWDAAELGVVHGLRDLGYRDAYRALHGYTAREPSWTWNRIAGHGGGWRIDHIFASSQLRPIACRYHHAWRDQQLSDHSALETDLA
jgi:hypothetical protein